MWMLRCSIRCYIDNTQIYIICRHDDVISKWLTKERCLTFHVEFVTSFFFFSLCSAATFNSFNFLKMNERKKEPRMLAIKLRICSKWYHTVHKTSPPWRRCYIIFVFCIFRFWAFIVWYCLVACKIMKFWMPISEYTSIYREWTRSVLLMDPNQQHKKNHSFSSSLSFVFAFLLILCIMYRASRSQQKLLCIEFLAKRISRQTRIAYFCMLKLYAFKVCLYIRVDQFISSASLWYFGVS